MKRPVLMLACAVLFGFGCSGADRSKATPVAPVADQAPIPAAPEEAEIAAPAVDPTVVPQGTLATVSVGAPGAMLTGFGVYSTAAGFPTAPAALLVVTSSGLSFDQPIALLVTATDYGPQLAFAGTAANEEALRDLARNAGWVAEIRDGRAVVGAAELVATASPHLRWRLDQPLPPELRFEVDGDLVNQAFAQAGAKLPKKPFAGFDSIAGLHGSIAFDGTDMIVKLLVGPRSGTRLEGFTRALAPSDFRLASAVSRPGERLFGAGTVDYLPLMDGMRDWMGPTADLWTSLLQVSDGAAAMTMGEGGAMVTVLGVKDSAAAAVAYEQVIRGMAAPVVNMNVAASGKLRVKKILGSWFHETITTFTPSATDAERASMRQMFGSETTRALAGVIDGVAISAAGPARDQAIKEVARRAQKPGPVANPAAAAAIAEAKSAGESFVFLMDLATFMASAMPSVADAVLPTGTTAARPPMRLGLSNVDGSLGFRLVLPAQQLDAIRAVAMAAQQP